MMTLKEIATAFDMSVDDFAKCIGYTRQALYSIAKNRHTARAKAAISLLRFLSDSMLQDEMEKVHQRHLKRRRAIEELRRMLLLDGDGNENV